MMDLDYSVDKEDMRSVIKSMAEQIKEGLKLSEGIEAVGSINRIFICGMGGSALPGDLLKSYLYNSKIPVIVVKDYHIPKYMNDKSLVFVISYSGNTEETISAYREVMKTGAEIIVITSGGKLEELAKMNDDTLIKVPKGIQPRQAIGYQFFPILNILQNSNIIENVQEDIKNTIAILSKTSVYEENAKNLAIKLQNRIPVIYSSNKLSILAEKWKISFNENCKMPAFYNVFPEMNHNEMNGYLNLNGDYYVIIIKDEDDNQRIRKRMKIFKDLVKEKGIDVAEMVIRGDSLLAKIFSGIYIGEWVSYYLALLLEQDPTPVDIVEDFKKRLNE